MSQTAAAATRKPRPFETQAKIIENRGRRWRITVSRFWVIAVTEALGPDCLVWVAERQHKQYASLFERVRGDDVPISVAKQAQAFHRECVASDRGDTVHREAQSALF